MSSAISRNSLLPTIWGSTLRSTVLDWNSPAACLSASILLTELSTLSVEILPECTASASAAIASGMAAGISRRSLPASNARTALSPLPYSVTMAPMISASVTTRP